MVSQNVQPPTKPQGSQHSTHVPPTIASDTHNIHAYCVTIHTEHKTTAVVFLTHLFQTVCYLEMVFMIEICRKKS
jgi:hypothetical protein